MLAKATRLGAELKFHDLESEKVDSPTRGISPPKPTGDENVITKLDDVLTQRQDRDSLPHPEPEVFKGDLLRYPMWIKSFETFIERKTKDPSERL